MAPTRIPDGFVLVSPRSREIATALLEAADELGADRQADVRTTLNGYHVSLPVAEKFQEAFPDADVESTDEAGADEAGDSAEPLPVTADSTHAEIDAYADSLDPKVTFPKDTNKAEKIAALEAARAPQPDAD